MWNDIGQGQFNNRPSYLNWDKEEPNDKHYDRITPQKCDGEDCVQINIWKGVVTWFDLDCNIPLPFICEKSRGKGIAVFSFHFFLKRKKTSYQSQPPMAALCTSDIKRMSERVRLRPH